MAVYKRGRVWYYNFRWNGAHVQENTRQGNKRTAEQMEAVHRTRLAKGEAGLTERKSPTLAHLLRESFLPFIEATKSEKPRTVAFYKRCAKNLLAWPQLADSRLNEITSETITAYVQQRQEADREAATINRELATLRRALRLAAEQGKLSVTPKIRLLAGEVCRERVLSPMEQDVYLKAASFPLRFVATIMLDCGLRPDEVYRLQWDVNYRDGQIVIHTGKSKAARRAIPVPFASRCNPQGMASESEC
jgi:integrase